MRAKDPEDASRSTEGLDRETLMGLNSPQTFIMDYLPVQLYAEGLRKERDGHPGGPPYHGPLMFCFLGRTLYFSKSVNEANSRVPQRGYRAV